jgi:hypothetical protein
MAARTRHSSFDTHHSSSLTFHDSIDLWAIPDPMNLSRSRAGSSGSFHAKRPQSKHLLKFHKQLKGDNLNDSVQSSEGEQDQRNRTYTISQESSPLPLAKQPITSHNSTAVLPFANLAASAIEQEQEQIISQRRTSFDGDQ